MGKTYRLWILSVCFAICAGTVSAGAPAREKVLLDTDMVEGFDDGVAMRMLACAPNIELLGVTTVSGNSWAPEGAAYAIRQLETVGRRIPVAEGTLFPLRPDRRLFFDGERQQFGLGTETWIGAFGHPVSEKWDTVYRERYGKEPPQKPETRHAVQFIIDTIRANPGEVTIAAIGPCGNLALAVRQAPDIAPLVKRVVYMGGSFFQPGNITPAAEFNWWFDPEAARIAVRSPFPEQVMVGLDVCDKFHIDRSRYAAIIAMLGGSDMVDVLESSQYGQEFAKNPGWTNGVWDLLVAAILIDPTLVKEEKTRRVDVNAEWGLNYGQSLAFGEDGGPVGSRLARIVMDIDQERFWEMVLAPMYWEK